MPGESVVGTSAVNECTPGVNATAGAHDQSPVGSTTAVHTVHNIELRTSVSTPHAQASLVSRNQRVYLLQAAATRIGRLTDNDIVLDDANVSRHHAVIIDTGTSFVITDLRSANGVDVGGERIRGTATLAAVIVGTGRIASLYVNNFNTVARAAYDRIGFTEVGTFATVLLD